MSVAETQSDKQQNSNEAKVLELEKVEDEVVPGKINLKTYEVTYAYRGKEYTARKYRRIDGEYLPIGQATYVSKSKCCKWININTPKFNGKFFFGVGRHSNQIWVPGKVVWETDEYGRKVDEEKLIYSYQGRVYETSEFQYVVSCKYGEIIDLDHLGVDIKPNQVKGGIPLPLGGQRFELYSILLADHNFELNGHKVDGKINLSECNGNACSYFYISKLDGKKFQMKIDAIEKPMKIKVKQMQEGSQLMAVEPDEEGSWFEVEQIEGSNILLRVADSDHLYVGKLEESNKDKSIGLISYEKVGKEFADK